MITSDAGAVGTFCLVLHSHLPWVVGHGRWPVGEEWLHQAWAESYLPVVDVLERLAGEGRRDLLTLGVTPVLAAQLDDPYALAAQHTWLGFWRMRAEELAQRPGVDGRLGRREVALAESSLQSFAGRWAHGGSAVIRPLVDQGTVELLGGPAAHPFLPLLDERVARFAIDTGLDDTARRLGRRSAGIWAPECAYRPGLELVLAGAGVGHVVLDGPTVQHVGADTARAYRLGDSDVLAFPRDLEVTYRVWSPRRGYPGGAHYRDRHTIDHAVGLRTARVTSLRTPAEQKRPYDPDRAALAVRADAEDFVTVVRRRLEVLRSRHGPPGLVVAAYDTELFGHWWHEGPAFLEQVLRLLPAADVRVTTLTGAAQAGLVGGSIRPEASSWGLGKDFAVWSGPAVADLVDEATDLQRRLLKVVDSTARPSSDGRRADLDALGTEAMLALASDWPFMVSHASAAAYARGRFLGHVETFRRLADRIEQGRPVTAGAAGRPFPSLDARLLATG